MTTKRATLEMPANEAKYQAAINRVISEIDRILKEMPRKQARIDKLRERTRNRLAELKAMR